MAADATAALELETERVVSNTRLHEQARGASVVMVHRISLLLRSSTVLRADQADLLRGEGTSSGERVSVCGLRVNWKRMSC